MQGRPFQSFSNCFVVLASVAIVSFLFLVLGIELRDSCVPGKHYMPEPYHQPALFLVVSVFVFFETESQQVFYAGLELALQLRQALNCCRTK